MKDLPLDRLTIATAALALASLYFFGKYCRRAYRDRRARLNPGMYRRELGRYGGRFFASGFFTGVFLLLFALSFHLATWRKFDQSLQLGKVVAHDEGKEIKLDLDIPPDAPRTVTVTGKFWILRADMLLFDARWRFLGLQNYVRPRSIDGLEKREDRIGGAYASRADIGGSSPVFEVLARLPGMTWLYTAKRDSSPLKPPRGEVEIHLIAGGFAG